MSQGNLEYVSTHYFCDRVEETEQLIRLVTITETMWH